MFRCVVAPLALALFAVPVLAQTARNFPANALRGELQFTQPPLVQLNGAAARLAPGARIRDENNMMQVSGALSGRNVVVHYTVDTYGQLRDIWLLTAAERARQPWPTTAAQANAWAFDPQGQVWRRP